ncbi:UNVERIFIED_CONTAM: hypothetical protein PYX00_005709 [Menopon gallinae]|uniref:Uncharacterized protein n=1 Tax=Menopon gallinae TaxID=328185 RepID=A0AAW2HTT4_9NEOP
MLLIFIHVFNVLLPVAVSVPTVYDQRQSGSSNVRIDVKDAVLIAIADEFGDYDYTYDYSDLTIKPEVPSTTAKPVSVTPAASSTALPSVDPKSTTAATDSTTALNPQNASLILDADNSTLTFVSKPGNETAQPEKAPTIHGAVIGQDYQIPVIVVHDVKENTKLLPVKIVEKSAPRNGSDGLPLFRNCSPGFFLDNHNRCKRIRKPLKAPV